MKFLGPTSNFPNWESSKWTENLQGIWLWRTVGFDYRISMGLGETVTLGGHKQNLAHTRTQGKGAGTPQETEPDLPVSVWGFQWRRGWQWLAVKTGALAGAVVGGAYWHKSSWRSPAALPQSLSTPGWVTSGQTTNKEGAQPHPLADNRIKDLLSMAPTARARPFSHQEACTILLSSSIRGQAKEARTIIPQPPEWKP